MKGEQSDVTMVLKLEVSRDWHRRLKHKCVDLGISQQEALWLALERFVGDSSTNPRPPDKVVTRDKLGEPPVLPGPNPEESSERVIARGYKFDPLLGIKL